MVSAHKTDQDNARLKSHRTRMTAKGAKRVEVTVPARDAALLKAIAEKLRAGGEDARRVRESLDPIVPNSIARTGAALVSFLRASPMTGHDIAFERDDSTGRLPDLG